MGTPVKAIAVMVIVAIVAAGAYYEIYLTSPASVTLTVYGSVYTADLTAVIKDFQGNHSYITVKYVEMTPPTAYQRITTELQANQSSADVAFITNSLMNPLKASGDLVAYNSSERSNYPSNYYQVNGYFATAILLPVVFSYNTNLVNSTILSKLKSNVSYLADPYWKNKMIMHDVTLGSTGTQYLLSLAPILGNSTWTRWVKALATNAQPTLTSDTTAVANGVAAGTYSLGIVTYLHDVVRLQRQGAPISYFLPIGVPLLTAPSSIGIVKDTKHLAEAKLFEDFMLSKAAQVVLGNSAVRFPAYPEINAVNTIEKVAPGDTVVLFPTAQVSADAKVWGPRFKAMGF